MRNDLMLSIRLAAGATLHSLRTRSIITAPGTHRVIDHQHDGALAAVQAQLGSLHRICWRWVLQVLHLQGCHQCGSGKACRGETIVSFRCANAAR